MVDLTSLPGRVSLVYTFVDTLQGGCHKIVMHRLSTFVEVILVPLSPAEMLKRGEGLGVKGQSIVLKFFHL